MKIYLQSFLGVSSSTDMRKDCLELRWKLLCYILGLFLVTAGILKAYELATLPLPGEGLLNDRRFLAAMVEFEALLGGWLLIGNRDWWTWLCVIVLWLAFFCTASYAAYTGAFSCGCLGRLHTKPLYMSVVDFAIVLLLILWRPDMKSALRIADKAGWRWMALLALAAASLGLGFWDINHYSSSKLSSDGLTFADGTVVLEPAKWVGHAFILVNYIDIGRQLTQGNWIVVLYNHDCERCRRALPLYAAISGQRSNHPTNFTVAFIEIPPFATVGQELVRPTALELAGRLTADYNWFAQTPIVVMLHNGIVENSSESDEAKDPALFLTRCAGQWRTVAPAK